MVFDGAAAEQPGGGTLEPVDANGFFVAELFLKIDAGVVAGFEHLFAGLGVAGFVAVDGGEGVDAGEVEEEGE